MNTLLAQAAKNKVESISDLTFHAPKLEDMCRSAAKDVKNQMAARHAQSNHPFWNADVDKVVSDGVVSMLTYLVVHGFSTECISSQASYVKLT